MNNFAFFFILVLGYLTWGSTEDTLNKLQVIFRHGYRYPTDQSWTKDDKCAQSYADDAVKLGNLTNLGKSQMRLLGYFLRIHYNTFIGDNASAVQVNYSDYNRDKESAQLVYEALFQDFNGQPGLKVDLLNPTMDGPEAINDTYYDAWLNKLPWSDRLQDQCKDLDKIGSVPCKNRSDYNNIVDQMVSEEAEGCDLPSWLDPKVKENLLAGYNALYESFKLCINKDFIHENSDDMLKWIIEVFKPGNDDLYDDVQLYASHDTNIGILLTRMGVFNSLPVPFGAAVFFEQHITENNSTIIRIFYDNSTDYSDFHKLKLPGCDWDCPYEKFVEIVTGSYDCNLAMNLQAFGLVITTIISAMLMQFSY